MKIKGEGRTSKHKWSRAEGTELREREKNENGKKMANF